MVRDLFRGYNKLIRPVQNMTQKVEVAFGLAFIQLINVVRWLHRVALLLTKAKHSRLKVVYLAYLALNINSICHVIEFFSMP